MTEAPRRSDPYRRGPGLVLSIDLGALAANWKYLADEVAPAKCAAVVKADAYGIGIEQAVTALCKAGCRTFFVALPEEGMRVRTVAPDAVIYVLNGFFPNASARYREHQLRPVLNSPEEVDRWAKVGSGSPSAIHVDTGMNRLGLSLHDTLKLARSHDLLSVIAPSLVISHLACADDSESPLNQTQLALFREVRAEFPGVTASLANSAAIFLSREYYFDLVRPGIALYGGEWAHDRPTLSTVVMLEARVLQIREAAAGEAVGYGAAERLKRDSRLAVLSGGYADGYHRMAGSSDTRPGAHAHIRGHSVPVVGRVSMDLLTIDVTDVPAAVSGDWVELFGPHLPLDEVAEAAGTIGYELLTGLSRRAERVYLGGGTSF